MSREEALEIIKSHPFLFASFPDDVLEALDVLIKQEPKTGHWIDDEFGSKCSFCGIYTHLDRFDRPMKFKYCSMCGAKMAESEKV